MKKKFHVFFSYVPFNKRTRLTHNEYETDTKKEKQKAARKKEHLNENK